MPPILPDTRIVVFAKAPVPGDAKTRLIPALGAEGAAALHVRLVKRALHTAQRARQCLVELCCTPDETDPFFQYCAGRYRVPLTVQATGDLGARMHAAFERTLSAGRYVILIGTDCPALTPRHFHQAAQALASGSHAAFIPAEDGGYALIALSQNDPSLFSDIPWSTDSVMGATRERLRALRWRWDELETLWDVDVPADYERLQASGLLDIGVVNAPGPDF
jgi:uncharacterized protein